MQLKLTRSQRDTGIVSKSVIFCLDARAELTREERENVSHYRLGGQVIYNSEASKRHLDRANVQNDGTMIGGVKGLASIALAAMRLNITINGLQDGQHIECKTLDELLGAEEAIMAACRNLKSYLDTAATFDGRETLIDFSTGASTVVAPAAPSSLLEMPPLRAASVQPAPQRLPPALAEVHTHAPGSIAIESASVPLRALNAADTKGQLAGEAFDFDALRERVAAWWEGAPTGQRIMVGGGGMLSLYVLYQIL